MSLAALKEAMPAYAKDIKLNLGSVLGNSTLPQQQLWGSALAVAITSRGETTVRAIDAEAREHLSEQAYTAAKGAAAIMAMNNVYYRSMHMFGHDEQYSTMPARLRMQIIGNPGVETLDFELWSLAVSAVNGCGRCLESHERVVREKGATREVVQEIVKVAAVIHAAAVTLEAEEMLASV